MVQSYSPKIRATCLILAGGQGKRLTPDKPLLEIDGLPIIERSVKVAASLFDEVLISTNTPGKYQFLGLPLIADERQGCGPLMGIFSGLRQIRNQTAFVCAADMPFLSQELIYAQYREMDDFDIVVPCPWNRPEFLHAFYSRRCLPIIQETLDANLFKIEILTQSCKTLRLRQDWFATHGLKDHLELAFANINTIQDYRCWQGQGKNGNEPEITEPLTPIEVEPGPGALKLITPDVLHAIRQTLIQQENVFQQNAGGGVYSSLWAHSSRAGRIAGHLAQAEGCEPEPAMLAGLLHDTGKFANGSYHEDDIPEEKHALEFVTKLLTGTSCEKWIPLVRQAILSMYLEDEMTSEIGRIAHDADNLDKLGSLGVAQFFAKNALRRRFLDDDLLIRASIELTYAHHAPDTLKTATGRSLARRRGLRTRRFYSELLEEWKELGLGSLDIKEQDIAGVVCTMVVPGRCSCGSKLEFESDIRDTIKCRSVVVTYPCAQCGIQGEYSFCLPNVKGLPRKRQNG